MIKRLRASSSKRNLPTGHELQTLNSGPERDGRGLLTPRAAGILGASFVIALCAGVLTYLAIGNMPARAAGAVIAAGAAFAGTVRLLDSIIT
jgi:hypothetical protein